MTDEQGAHIHPGDVLQFVPEHEMFAGCFLIVEETASWGVRLGFVAIPKARGELPGAAYCRPKWSDVEYIGKAVFVPRSLDEPTP